MKGFTLVEILIVVIILTMLMFWVFQLMEAGRSSWFEGEASAQLRQDIMRALMRMESELKETRSIPPSQISLAIGASSPTLTFSIPQIDPTTDTILNPAGAINWSVPIIYALDVRNNQITRTDTSNGNVTIIANHVTNLTFTRDLNALSNILRIDITAGKTNMTRRNMQDTQRIRVKMRN